MKYAHLFIFAFNVVLIASCGKDLEQKVDYHANGSKFHVRYYDSGQIAKQEIFTKDGKLESIVSYTDGKISGIKAYNNNNLISEVTIGKENNSIQKIYYNNKTFTTKGKTDGQGRKTGWWTVFDEQGLLREKQEFMVIENEEILNQTLSYKANGEIDVSSSFFVTMDFEQTDKPRTYIGKLNYKPVTKRTGQVAICLSQKITPDFRNINDVQLYTIAFKGDERTFPMVFETSGEKILRGYILERSLENPADTVKMKTEVVPFIETKMYFEKKVLVK